MMPIISRKCFGTLLAIQLIAATVSGADDDIAVAWSSMRHLAQNHELQFDGAQPYTFDNNRADYSEINEFIAEGGDWPPCFEVIADDHQWIEVSQELWALAVRRIKPMAALAGHTRNETFYAEPPIFNPAANEALLFLESTPTCEPFTRGGVMHICSGFGWRSWVFFLELVNCNWFVLGRIYTAVS